MIHITLTSDSKYSDVFDLSEKIWSIVNPLDKLNLYEGVSLKPQSCDQIIIYLDETDNWNGDWFDYKPEFDAITKSLADFLDPLLFVESYEFDGLDVYS